MDDKLITTLLQDIAHEEIPDDMPSLWTDIEQQLSTRPARRALHVTRLGWVAAIVVLSLMLSAGAYAFVQLNDNNDAGMQQIQDKNLVTPIEESITIDGVTVTLDWAYADAHRIALSYSMAQEITYSGDEPPEDTPIALTTMGPGRLTDDQGHTFVSMFGGGGGGGGPVEDDDTSDVKTISLLAGANDNFDASPIEGTPDMLTLRYEIMVGIQTEPIPFDPETTVPSSGGGGGGGGGGGPAPGATPPPTSGGGGGGGGGGGNGDAPPAQMHPSGVQETVGPFVFEFSVPFIPAVQIPAGATEEANDVTMTLQQASAAPSMTRATVCFSGMPGDAGLWTPVASLDTGDDVLNSIGSGFIETDDPSRQCFELQFLAAYDRTAQTWTLTVDELQIQSHPDPEALVDAFAEYGITVEIQESGAWQTSEVPEGVDFAQVMDEVMRSFMQIIEGPWTFTLEVPAP